MGTWCAKVDMPKALAEPAAVRYNIHVFGGVMGTATFTLDTVSQSGQKKWNCQCSATVGLPCHGVTKYTWLLVLQVAVCHITQT